MGTAVSVVGGGYIFCFLVGEGHLFSALDVVSNYGRTFAVTLRVLGLDIKVVYPEPDK